jgi:hypothetical protein
MALDGPYAAPRWFLGGLMSHFDSPKRPLVDAGPLRAHRRHSKVRCGPLTVSYDPSTEPLRSYTVLYGPIRSYTVLHGPRRTRDGPETDASVHPAKVRRSPETAPRQSLDGPLDGPLRPLCDPRRPRDCPKTVQRRPLGGPLRPLIRPLDGPRDGPWTSQGGTSTALDGS